MGVVAIDLYLFEQRELSIELFRSKVKYLKGFSSLLVSELIARHCYDLKAMIFPLLIRFHHFCVVAVGESSL
jgi:hypothetical protein